VTIPISLTLYVIYIAPSSVPLPTPLKAIVRGLFSSVSCRYMKSIRHILSP
jgi:hypothetical protein